MRRCLAVGLLALALLPAGCTKSADPLTSTQRFGAATRLPDLQHPGRNVDLFSRFNQDRGVPRLVLLLSPT